MSGRGRSRRASFWLLSGITLCGTLIACVLAVAIAERHAIRWDLTATGEHRLSPRTEQTLARLRHDFEIVVAGAIGPGSSKDEAGARGDVADVLDLFDRTSPRVGTSWIDTSPAAGDTGGPEAFAELLRVLRQRDEVLLAQWQSALQAALDALASASESLVNEASAELIAIRQAMAASGARADQQRDLLDQAAAAARVTASELGEAVNQATTLLNDSKERQAIVDVPPVDRGGGILSRAEATAGSRLGNIASALRALVEQSGQNAGPDAGAIDPAMAARLRSVAARLDAIREQMARAAQPLTALARPAVLRVSDALKADAAVLVVGPPEIGVTAIPFDSLFPSRAALEASRSGAAGFARADVRRRAEELLATALATLAEPLRPIVVIMHAEQQAFVERTPVFSVVIERLSRRGIDVREWAVLASPDPPTLPTRTTSGERPVVYVSLAPDSTASGGAGAPGGGKSLTGAERAQALGRALEALATQGKPLLVCLSPSIFPTYGDPDPIASVLARFGLAPATGRAVMQRVASPGAGERGVVETDFVVQAVERVVEARVGDGAVRTTGDGATTGRLAPAREVGDKAADAARQGDGQRQAGGGNSGGESHAILGSVRGLPTFFRWPVPLYATPVAQRPGRAVAVHDLFAIDAGGQTWAETQWLRLWQAPVEHRAFMEDAPGFDEGLASTPPAQRDARDGPWTIVAAAELREGDLPAQRVIAAGSNAWFTDFVTGAERVVDGRVVRPYAGNAELFEACVLWLAGQDELIAQSPEAQAIPIIQSLTPRQVLLLRVLVIAGLPGLVLVLAAVVRLLRP